ncbi:MAG: pyruvate kinase, partial [Planctomycetaceae bacterium]
MDLRRPSYSETPLVKTKIIATVGPACGDRAGLQELARAGVDLFRLNFAHGEHDWLQEIAGHIRSVAEELERPIGILGDLAGPKIRLGPLPEQGVFCEIGQRFEFVRAADRSDPRQLTSTYDGLVDDLRVGDRVLLADGTVSMNVIDSDGQEGRALCEVEHPGLIRSRQGINLPGVAIKLPTLTDKDREDVAWAVEHQIDFLGLSFVRSPEDIDLLRSVIEEHASNTPPQIVAKIEKLEAVTQIEEILERTDAAMVARGDLGVEVDMARVPVMQKRIIKLCKQYRVPVITATQMLD